MQQAEHSSRPMGLAGLEAHGRPDARSGSLPDVAPPAQLAHARPEDLQALVALEQASFSGDRISARSWRRLIASRSALVIVARAHAPGLPLLGAAVVLRRTRSSVARLYSIAAAPSARGRGISDLLLREVIRQSRKGGAALLRLETRVDNHAAQRLFVRHGFMPLDGRPAYYEDGSDALRFQRAVGARLRADAGRPATFIESVRGAAVNISRKDF